MPSGEVWMNDISLFAQQGAVGFLAMLAVLEIGVVYWLLKQHQQNYNACNERVEKLVSAHIDFVKQTAHDISMLIARTEHVLEKIEKMIAVARDCIDGN